MQEDKVVQTQNTIPLFSLIYKKLALVIMIVILFTLLGAGYGVLRARTTYTVNRSFILGIENSGTTENNVSTLGQLYIPQVVNYIKTYADDATQIYNKNTRDDGIVSANAVGVRYNEDSLIFTLTYTDYTYEKAAAKLHSLYLVSVERLSSDVMDANGDAYIKLIDTDNVIVSVINNKYEGFSYTQNNGFTKFLFIGAALGVIVSLIVVLLSYSLDNTVKDKDELEQLTGSSIIGYIEKIKK